MVRSATPDEEFWSFWRAYSGDMKNDGFSVGKDRKDGSWQVVHWKKLSYAKLEEEKKSIEESRSGDSSIDAPSPVGLDYFPFQKAGIEFIHNRKNVLLGDEMGTGKSIQTIGTINLEKPDRVLIICPAGLKLNWESELRKWLVDDYDINVMYSTSTWPKMDQRSVVIMNYEILHKFQDELREKEWDLLVLDEAQYIKNSKTQRSKNITGAKQKKISPLPAKKKLLLTGTPIINRPSELWNLIHYLDPELWDNWKFYVYRYCGAYKDGFGLNISGASNLEELQKKLRSSVMIRRLKKDVLKELPEKMREVILIDSEDNNIVRALKNEKEVLERIKDSDDSRLSKLTEISKVRHEMAIAKVPFVMNHVNMVLESTDKLVIFAHHKDVISSMRGYLDKKKIKSVVVTGDVSMKDRNAAINEFQNNPDTKVFIGTIGAAGTGITLTASHHVIFAELDWAPGNVSQAESRCARIGQKNAVLIQHLVVNGSIDSKIVKSLINKQRIIDEALDIDFVDKIDVEEII